MRYPHTSTSSSYTFTLSPARPKSRKDVLLENENFIDIDDVGINLLKSEEWIRRDFDVDIGIDCYDFYKIRIPKDIDTQGVPPSFLVYNSINFPQIREYIKKKIKKNRDFKKLSDIVDLTTTENIVHLVLSEYSRSASKPETYLHICRLRLFIDLKTDENYSILKMINPGMISKYSPREL